MRLDIKDIECKSQGTFCLQASSFIFETFAKYKIKYWGWLNFVPKVMPSTMFDLVKTPSVKHFSLVYSNLDLKEDLFYVIFIVTMLDAYIKHG